MIFDELCISIDKVPVIRSALPDKLSPRSYDFVTEDTQIWYSLYENIGVSLYEKNDGSYQKVTLRADEILLIPPGSHHIDEVYETPYKYHGYILHIDSKIELFEQLEILRTKGELKVYFEKLTSEWIRRMPGYQLRCQILLLQLFEKLREILSADYINSKKYLLIEPAIKLIHEKYREGELSIDKLAELCGISSQYFHRIFYEKTHTTPRKYIEELRMKYARELLESSKLTVCEVAELCGCENAANFARSFKRYYDITPTEAMRRGR